MNANLPDALALAPEFPTEVATESLMYITDRPNLIFVRGEGSWLWDQNNRRYLDFIQGWAVNALGHCPVEIIDALTHQASRLINPGPAYFNAPSSPAGAPTDRAQRV